jgi:HAE1 family hydrophobic/amphiphilic exporter-1
VIYRENRGRYVQINTDLQTGVGVGDVMQDILRILSTEVKLPNDIRPSFGGDAENFVEMQKSFGSAITLGILLTYLILASLYESFVTPITILLSIPLSVCGAFFALYFAGQSINLMSMLGMIMLISQATKSAVVLIDYATERMREEGKDIATAIKSACRTRFRPVMMSSLSTIIGMLPIAYGMSEASQQRVSMGWVIIGGMIASTFLTLLIIPTIFIYVDKLRRLCLRFFVWMFKYQDEIVDF